MKKTSCLPSGTVRFKLVVSISLFVLLLSSSTVYALAYGLKESANLENLVQSSKFTETKKETKISYKTQTTNLQSVGTIEAFDLPKDKSAISEENEVKEEPEVSAEEVLPKKSAPAPVKPKTTTTLPVGRHGKTTTTKTQTTTTAKVDITALPDGRHGKQAQAEKILASYIAKYPILEGVTIKVQVPTNPKWQGCTYYAIGLIIINPNHVASLEKIIWHECEHIIDWKEDGDIDHNDYWE